MDLGIDRFWLAVIAVAAISVALVVGWRSYGDEFGAQVFRVLLAERTSPIPTLDVPKRTVELPTETARRVRDAIRRDDFATAGKIAANTLAESRMTGWRFYPFTDFVESIADLDDPEFEGYLDNWVAKRGADTNPLLVRAEYYNDLAWARRGHGFNKDTPADKQAAFRTYMDKALADSEAALQAGASSPFAFALHLKILRGRGLTQELLVAFGEAIAKQPDYYPLYSTVLEMLQPKWGGNIPAMYTFVDRYAGSAPATSPLQLLYVELYNDLVDAAGTQCSVQGLSNDKLTACVSDLVKQIMAPGVEAALPGVMRLYDTADKYEFGLALERTITDALNGYDGLAYGGALLEAAAEGLHSNTELTPDHPVANNYVIDELVGLSWYLKGNYDNALTKYRAALDDVSRTAFPDEAARDVAQAGVYEHIADTYARINLPDSIAYSEAAVTLGDRTLQEYLACYDYDQIKNYDAAIATCSKAIDEGANAPAAHYWRAVAYGSSGDNDNALKDFAVAAGADTYVRSAAAINMSMVYFARHDNQGALDVLNRYDFLYDPARNDNEGMSVAYNNRCYAYMQLGQLQKALDDCNASLKYGAIPDAMSKQQQLLKMLQKPAAGL